MNHSLTSVITTTENLLIQIGQRLPENICQEVLQNNELESHAELCRHGHLFDSAT